MNLSNADLAIQYWTLMREGKEVHFRYREHGYGEWSDWMKHIRPNFSENCEFEIREVPNSKPGPVPVSAGEAIEALSVHMQNDPDYAWVWHCNLAMLAYDAGAPHQAANVRAADFMSHLFGVDTSKSPDFPKPKSDQPDPAQTPAPKL